MSGNTSQNSYQAAPANGTRSVSIQSPRAPTRRSLGRQSDTKSSFHQAGGASSTHNNSSSTVYYASAGSSSKPPSTTSTYSATSITPCNYHRAAVLQPQSRGQQTPLDRFLAEGPGQQYALFNRADTGQTSLARSCTCYAAVRAGGYQHPGGHPMELAEEDVFGGERGQ